MINNKAPSKSNQNTPAKPKTPMASRRNSLGSHCFNNNTNANSNCNTKTPERTLLKEKNTPSSFTNSKNKTKPTKPNSAISVKGVTDFLAKSIFETRRASGVHSSAEKNSKKISKHSDSSKENFAIISPTIHSQKAKEKPAPRPYMKIERADIKIIDKAAIKRELANFNSKKVEAVVAEASTAASAATPSATPSAKRRNSIAINDSTNNSSKHSILHKQLEPTIHQINQSPQKLECFPEDTENNEVQIQLNDSVTSEREKIIQQNISYFKKYKDIPKTTTENYKLIKEIGKGSFGRVTLCLHKITGKYVAIKSIDKARMKDEHSKKKILREVYILKSVKHANIIRLLEVFESNHHVHLVMENAGGGDLLQFVRKKKRLSENEAKIIFRQIVYGLGHIHARSILHRDIKLDNILLDADQSIKICDFGISRIIDLNEKIKERCGTPAYLAPEIIANHVFLIL